MIMLLITKISDLFPAFNIKDKYDKYHMIFELADGGTLRNYLRKKFNELTWKDKYNLALGITNGLKYLHKLNIIHKDLVFITWLTASFTWEIKVIDKLYIYLVFQ